MFELSDRRGMLIRFILLSILWPAVSLAELAVSQGHTPGTPPTQQRLTNPGAGGMQRGTVLTMALADDPQQTYYLYVPHDGGIGRPIFVTVHGISRNALEHAQRFASVANKYGVVLVAPLFSEKRFPNYQRLLMGGGGRPDRVLQRIVAEVGTLTDAKTEKIYLFGYSGGGQFTHRYAMTYPDQVAGFVVGAAGWYTFPRTDTKYPYGIKSSRDFPDQPFDPTKFLAVPGGVVVGVRDNKRGSALNKSQKINAEEGGNRTERGHQWINAMNAAAHDRGLSKKYFFETMPRCGHSFSQCMKRGNMGPLVFEHLFPGRAQATDR